MKHAIQTLENERKSIERKIRENNLMQNNMKIAAQELSKITQLKKAIKILRCKDRKV